MFAPLEGVSHPILRELTASRGGVGVVCTEFVRVTKNPLSDKTVKKHVVRPSRGALSVQVMGNDVEQMAEATELVTRAGADIVDINCGCPAPKAVRKGVGSAMLKDRALLGRVVRAMRERTHLPLSAKIRAGYDDAAGVLDIARTLEDAGVDFITVHPRRRSDFYGGVADWRIIARLVEALGIVVVGNGDIWTAEDAQRIRRETGCQAVMMGRPLLRNPWIFRQLAALERGDVAERPTGEDVLAYYRRLKQELDAAYDPKGVTGLLKEQVRYLGRAVADGGAFMKSALRAADGDGILWQVEQLVSAKGSDELWLGPADRGSEPRGAACDSPDAQRSAMSRNASPLASGEPLLL
jgi:nifR3 family TIM-barrel protein